MGILGLARKMVGGLGGSEPLTPQLYQVSCVAGHRLRGERTEGYQALRCPTCGDGIFVLPRSPLPEPPAATIKGPARSRPEEAFVSDDEDLIALTDPPSQSGYRSEGEDADIEIEWEEDSAPTSAPAPAVAAPVRSSPSETPRKPAPSRPAPAKPAPARPSTPVSPGIVLPPRPSLGTLARRYRPQLLTAGVLVLVLGALWIRQGRLRLENLPKIAERGRTEGLTKLDAGEFHIAKRILAEAAAAVDGLRGRVEGAEEIRQGAREAAIFTDLVPESLEKIVDEAATYRGDGGWTAHFKSLYRGRSVVLDAPLVEVLDPSRPGSQYRIEYRIYLGRGPRPSGEARFDLKDFTLFADAQSTAGEQKPFGARLDSIELDESRNEWVIRFEPESGVFITHPRALESLGWPVSDSVEEIQP